MQNERPEVPGKNVYLTLDHSIQANAEEVLRDTVRKWGAKSASAIVLDPRTGAVLAMAVQPGYDANSFPSVPSDLQRNRTVTDTYEPGSTFKLITVAGSLTERIVSPDDTVHAAVLDACRGPRDPRRGAAGHRELLGRADPRALVEHRRDHARGDAGPRRGCRPGSRSSASDERPASTSPARAPASSCRPTSGPARRSATCRSARESP